MEKTVRRISMLLFLGFLFIMGMMSVFGGIFNSDDESKKADQMAQFTIKSYFSGDYSSTVQSYLCNIIFKHDKWQRLATDIELCSGKLEVNGVYITENRQIEHLYEPDYTLVDQNIEAVNEYASQISVPVYFMLAPTSAGIYADELYENAPQYNQESFIDYVYAKFDDNIKALDIFMTMKSADEEYIYYKNDMHWTSLGAYYAYYYAISKLGFTPVSFSQYNIERMSAPFYGSLYSKTLYDGFGADYVDIFTCESGIKVKSLSFGDEHGDVYDTLYFREKLDNNDKYSLFLGGDFPLININTEAQSGKSLLIIKDSYANCFVPFLTQHYSKITLVDMSCISSGLDTLVSADDYSQVLFLYNASNFASDTNLKKIA